MEEEDDDEEPPRVVVTMTGGSMRRLEVDAARESLDARAIDEDAAAAGGIARMATTECDMVLCCSSEEGSLRSRGSV